MKVRRLSATLGVEISGLNLGRPLGSETVEAIRRLWLEHGLVLFPDQVLTTEDQQAFAEQFGEIERMPASANGRHPESCRYVSNRRVGGYDGILPRGAVDLHFDACFRPRPYRAALLFALEAPRRGGETVFADGFAAYAKLPYDLKAHVDTLRACNGYWLGAATREENLLRDDSLQHVYPLVVAHPETGQPILYVNRLMTQSIEGVPDVDGQRLLDLLFDHIEKPEFGYVHTWRAGDLVMWDNYRVAHGRNAFAAEEARVLRRMIMRGEALASPHQVR